MEMNRKQFEQKVMEEQPVLVEFWAPWCSYCRRIGPALEKVSRQYAGKVTVGKVNIDEEPRLAHQDRPNAGATIAAAIHRPSYCTATEEQ